MRVGIAESRTEAGSRKSEGCGASGESALAKGVYARYATSMSVFIGYRSAYEYWRTNDALPASVPSRAHPSCGVRAEGARDGLEEFEVPLHVVVAQANDRVRTGDPVCHVWNAGFPAGSFVKLRDGAYISSPERSFMEMAAELSLVELIRYGYVLCSGYAYDKGESGFRARAPLASVRSLQRFVEKSHGRTGSNKAVRAMRFIADASASPMETNLTMALCLPRMIGGYGLDIPELNLRIEVRTKGLVPRDHFKCDLYWRRQHVAVEYDSGEHHSGVEAETKDSARRSALLSQGVTVASITPDQFFDARKFDEAARAVAKLLGKRLPANEAAWMMRRYRLRHELLQDTRQGRPR